jgi:hypothetical protein
MENPKSPPAARVAAASAILDRAYGKPPQATSHTGKVGLTLEEMLVDTQKKDAP